MGTRGAMGVRIGGVDKVSYVHFDSYPEGLGADIVGDVRQMLRKPGLQVARELARSLRLVDESTAPTSADINHLAQYSNTGVSEQRIDHWYCLLHRLQGTLLETLIAGTMLDGGSFLDDSIFCEYAYIVNFDDETFEVYKGFQKAPHDRGRYASPEPTCGNIDRYYPVALAATFPLLNIPSDWARRAFPPDPDEEEEPEENEPMDPIAEANKLHTKFKRLAKDEAHTVANVRARYDAKRTELRAGADKATLRVLDALLAAAAPAPGPEPFSESEAATQDPGGETEA